MNFYMRYCSVFKQINFFSSVYYNTFSEMTQIFMSKYHTLE